MRFRGRERHIPEGCREALEKIHRSYNYLEHLRAGASGLNAQLVRESGVEDYLADRYAVVGTPEECLLRLEQLRNWGISKIWLNTYNQDKIAFMNQWSKSVSAKLL
jgi:hypothetical protein